EPQRRKAAKVQSPKAPKPQAPKAQRRKGAKAQRRKGAKPQSREGSEESPAPSSSPCVSRDHDGGVTVTLHSSSLALVEPWRMRREGCPRTAFSAVPELMEA